jgi:hypothetical protein
MGFVNPAALLEPAGLLRVAQAGGRLPGADHVPAGPVFPAVRVSCRDVEELLTERGPLLTTSPAAGWVQRFTPEFIEAAQPRRCAAVLPVPVVRR